MSGVLDSVRLFDATGVVVDQLDWGPGDLGRGDTFGRCRRERGRVGRLAQATPGGANAACEAPGDALEIHEVFLATALSWVEVFNRGDSPVDLAGWSVSPTEGGFAHGRVEEPGTVVVPGGFGIIDLSVIPWEFPEGAERSLALYDPTGRRVDVAAWTAWEVGLGEAAGACGDDVGEAPWGRLSVPTRATPNADCEPVVPSVRLSEIRWITRPSNSERGWVELENVGSAAVDVGGYSLAGAGPDVVVPGRPSSSPESAR